MEPWIGIALFASIIVVICYVVYQGINRARSYRLKAEEPGFDCTDVDDELAGSLNGKLPMFSQGESSCWSVIRGPSAYGDCAIFQYSYVYKNKLSGRVDRENVGLVFFLESGWLGERLVVRDDDTWQIEHAQNCLAMRKKADDGKQGLSGEQLEAFHRDVMRFLDRLVSVSPKE